MVNASGGVYASSWRTSPRRLTSARSGHGLVPKMGMDPGLACPAAQDCAQMGPGVKHPPKVTQNGYRVVFTRRNRETRHVLSLPCAGAGDQAASRDGVGCPKKLMPGVIPRDGTSPDMLTLRLRSGQAVGRVTGKVRVLAEVEL
jgi:hypothetical protein